MTKPPKIVSDYFRKSGAKGGKKTGPAKRRSKEHYRAAALKRWEKKT